MPDGGRSSVHSNPNRLRLVRLECGRIVFQSEQGDTWLEVKLRSQDRLLFEKVPKSFRQKYHTACTFECLYIVVKNQAGIIIPNVRAAGCPVSVQLAELISYNGFEITLIGIAPLFVKESLKSFNNAMNEAKTWEEQQVG